jgi:hypothetical protein
VELSFRSNPAQAYEGLRQAAEQARRHQDKEAYLNCAFYLNNQYVEWSDDTANVRYLFKTPQEESQKPRPVINKIMHFTNQQHAFALQTKPMADVLPANDSEFAITDANVANAYLSWLADPNVGDWNSCLSDATHWALVANSSYIKWIWNPKLKRPEFIFVPSVDLYVDPYARQFRNARWAIHSQFLDPEQVYDLYGKEVKPNQVQRADLMKSELLRDMGVAPIQQGCVVNELWHLPSRRYEKGIHVVWCGKDVIYGPTPFPYEHGRLPFTQIGVVPRPNSQYFASPVTFLRDPQAELNKYHAQRISTREFFANLKWWIPESVELQADPDDTPNQILRGGSSAGEAPAIIGPPAMPENNDGAWIGDEMMNVVGLHETSQGQVPGRVEAAKAIEILRESDASRLAVLLATTATTISQGFYQMLMLTRQYRAEEIVVNAYGPEGVPEVKRFMANRLDPSMRLKVTVGTGLAFTRAARTDQLITLWTNGILTDPESFAELAELPMPTILNTKAADIRLARAENYKMADTQEGTALTPNSWDDHPIHIREHNNHRKTAEFASYSMEKKKKFEFHVETHEKLYDAFLQKELDRQQKIATLSGQVPTGPAPQAQPPTAATASEGGPTPEPDQSQSQPDM